jgi:Spy/CpxP family protein refolding chaperone
MKTKQLFTVAMVAISAFLLCSVSADEEEHFSQILISPQFIMEHAEGIGFTAEQKAAVRAAAEEAHSQSKEKMVAVNESRASLKQTLESESIDETAALTKLETILNAESAVKRVQLKLLVQVNNLLSPQQRSALRSAQQKTAWSVSTRERLEKKLEKVRVAVMAQSETGSPPFAVSELMTQFPKLMQTGKHKEAEAILDEALQRLNVGKPQTPVPTPPQSADSPEKVCENIEAMRVKDIAWRKIEWKTCLLDGIKASREQNKPIILWVFIDLTVDDKRC